ncbi:MAG: hypothetical protein HFI67_09765 [Lachnospiraceae bacterium]|jgi:hypothetical protein|nr:hypothetical protein [Lachnospiraceae bacterium]
MDKTITLTITGQDHYELQGLLSEEGDQEPIPFRSVLELILLLDKKMKHPAGPEKE